MNDAVNLAGAAQGSEINAIDRDLLTLVAQRLAAEADAADANHAAAPLHPARDIATLRGLIAAAPTNVEPELIVEIWRALAAAALRKRRVVDVAVGGARNDPARLFDIARRHFGARTRIAHVGDPQAALLRAAENPETCVAVTPWPAAPGVGSWWPALSESRFHALHLVAGLPMLGPIDDTPEACVFSASTTEPAGGDISLLLVEDPHHRSQRALNEVGLRGREVARSEPRAMLRVEAYLAANDARARALADFGLDRVRVLGAYARV